MKERKNPKISLRVKTAPGYRRATTNPEATLMGLQQASIDYSTSKRCSGGGSLHGKSLLPGMFTS